MAVCWTNMKRQFLFQSSDYVCDCVGSRIAFQIEELINLDSIFDFYKGL